VTELAPAEPDYPPPPRAELFWPALATVLAAIGLQVALPDRLDAGPRWLMPALEGALLLFLALASPRQLEHEHRLRRRLAISVTALVSVGNAISLGLLANLLLHRNVANGHQLIIAGTLIWLTNVLIFALWYWEVDRGGPGQRAAGRDDLPDLLFPQMTDAQRYSPGWRPRFIDYLYVSLTNATAFSPTDTMPLSAAAKSMMGLQSLVSLVVIGLVVSRAVNIL
jgi:uncharacterized membrane protein